MDLISQSDTSIQPRATHIKGNMHLSVWDETEDKFPQVMVKIATINEPTFTSTLSNKNFGERYVHSVVLYVQDISIVASRDLADKIIDYLFLNNKQADVRIIDMYDFSAKEAVINKRGSLRYWRVQVDFKILTEESLI
jgi:ferredoxin-fold anticodon binding domain-containing protein